MVTFWLPVSKLRDSCFLNPIKSEFVKVSVKSDNS